MTDAVCKHGESIGYRVIDYDIDFIGNVLFYDYGKYQRCNLFHIQEKLSIEEFFKLTKEDVVMSKPEIKQDQDILHRLDDFFTKLLDGRIKIKDTNGGLCDLLNEYLLKPSEVFGEVIDVTEWNYYSGRVNYPVPLYDVNPESAFKTHGDKWDKKHPYGRNRWEFVEWCHEQVKSKIDQANQEDIEFPVLAKGLASGRVVLFDNYNSGLIVGSHLDYEICDYAPTWEKVTDSESWKILKTAKELGLTLRNDK